jgi:hypothetical protein
VRAFATISLAASLGAAPTRGDGGIESYSVPVRIDVRLHKLITVHFHLNGMQYFTGR